MARTLTHTERSRAYRAKKIAHYLATHGTPPNCECGCGNAVNFDQAGKPNRYIHGHYRNADTTAATAARLKDTIPIADFRDAVRRISTTRGWTLKEIAYRGGLDASNLYAIMYRSDRRSVSRTWARDFFTRLAGGATTPTPAMMRRMKQANRAEKELKAL